MNITAELIKWAFAHPVLASLLGITVIGGGAAVSVARGKQRRHGGWKGNRERRRVCCEQWQGRLCHES